MDWQVFVSPGCLASSLSWNFFRIWVLYDLGTTRTGCDWVRCGLHIRRLFSTCKPLQHILNCFGTPSQFIVHFITHSFIYLQSQSFSYHFLTTSVSTSSSITINTGPLNLPSVCFGISFSNSSVFCVSVSPLPPECLERLSAAWLLAPATWCTSNQILATARPRTSILLLYQTNYEVNEEMSCVLSV